MNNDFQNYIYKIIIKHDKAISAESAWNIAGIIEKVAKPKTKQEMKYEQSM